MDKVEFKGVPFLVPLHELRNFVARARKLPEQEKSTPVSAGRPEGTGSRAISPGMTAEAARELLAEKKASVVAVRGVLKYMCGDCEKEHQTEIRSGVGVVVDPAGWVICSGIGSRRHKLLEQQLTYILEDGTEIPALLVLQDHDLGLAVLAPALRSDKTMPSLKAIQLRPEVQGSFFANVLTVSRLGDAHHNAVASATGKITGLGESAGSPVVTDASFTQPDANSGSAVFLSDGSLLGVSAVHTDTDKGAQKNRQNPMDSMTSTPVVPAAALMELLRQAKASYSNF
jgi:S1-C subfamily serine protease